MQPANRAFAVAEIEERLRSELPHWRFENGSIRRRYRTQSFKSALLVAGAVGHLAEAAFHHPELLVTYSAVEVRLSTHSAGGVTDKDFELAGRIESLITWNPATEVGTLRGAPDDPRHRHVRGD